MNSRLAAWAVRLFGVMLMLSCLGYAAVRAPDRSLESLIPRWAPPPSEFIELNGQVVHLRDEGPRGDPLPLVLLHGTASSLHTWEGWVAELKKTHRVVTVDLPGFGLTGPSADGDYRDEAYQAFVLALMDRLQLQRVVLGGNSLGGLIAWEVAARHPERVGALVLVDAGGYAIQPEPVPGGFQVARAGGLLARLGKYVLPRSFVERSVRNVYGDPSRVTGALVDRYFEMTLREGNREALGRRMAQSRPGDHADEIRTVRQPTLILWGARDHLVPIAAARAFARDIPESRLVTFETLGHVPQEEDPAATVAPVRSFLDNFNIET
ncbi:alpha/beta fold hydrolase [Pelomonas sp. KK5]|uniref:alpha/beta fold hydrolase n=1 Tax=Pelomonas sp. KK5 TaxID=1855730 RepID=UPI00097C58A7|nr:alpha/beta hydrolase [Pelomonas sp. KK5]